MGSATKKRARKAKQAAKKKTKKAAKKAKRAAKKKTKKDRKPVQPELGLRCSELRTARGLAQLDMVRYHDFSLSHYQKIEYGLLDCQLSTLQRLAGAFDVTLSEFFKGISNEVHGTRP